MRKFFVHVISKILVDYNIYSEMGLGNGFGNGTLEMGLWKWDFGNGTWKWDLEMGLQSHKIK
jgi:hypothetical protein